MNTPHAAKCSEHLTTTGNTARKSKEREEEIRHDTKITKGEMTTNTIHKSNDVPYSTECSWSAQATTVRGNVQTLSNTRVSVTTLHSLKSNLCTALPKTRTSVLSQTHKTRLHFSQMYF